jgi:hypothetical protein
MQKSYKNCVIKAQPLLLVASKVWAVNFAIVSYSPVCNEKIFTFAETYPSKAVALDRCIELAIRIIDGTLPGYSLS